MTRADLMRPPLMSILGPVGLMRLAVAAALVLGGCDTDPGAPSRPSLHGTEVDARAWLGDHHVDACLDALGDRQGGCVAAIPGGTAILNGDGRVNLLFSPETVAAASQDLSWGVSGGARVHSEGAGGPEATGQWARAGSEAWNLSPPPAAIPALVGRDAFARCEAGFTPGAPACEASGPGWILKWRPGERGWLTIHEGAEGLLPR